MLLMLLTLYRNMCDVYLLNTLFTKFLLTQILDILMANKLLYTRCLFDHKIFSRRMTNHLEIKMYCHGSFRESPEFSKTFLFMQNRSSEQVLESSRRIEKLLVVTWLF